MKKNMLRSTVAAMLIGTATLMAVGCTKDYSDSVAGTYTGDVQMSMGERELGTMTGCTITISATGDNTVRVKVPESSGGQGMTVEAYNIEPVSVDKSGKTYTLTNTSYTATVGDNEISGNANGSVENGKLTFNYTMNAGPHVISYAFKTK